jgi:DNA-directed RNA polymerase specialized sigma subunit
MDSKLYSEIGAAVKRAEKNDGDLTTKNLFYVAKVAKDLSSKTGADFDMLFSEGVIAMKKSEEKYDPEKNDSFVKFAGVSVRGYMLNAINRQGSLVHIPVNHQKGFKKGQEAEADTNVQTAATPVPIPLCASRQSPSPMLSIPKLRCAPVTLPCRPM